MAGQGPRKTKSTLQNSTQVRRKRIAAINEKTKGQSLTEAFEILAGMPAGMFEGVKKARRLDKIGTIAANAIGNTIGTRSSREHHALWSLLQKLTSATPTAFPLKGQPLNAPIRKGVYIIYGPTGRVCHIGRSHAPTIPKTNPSDDK